MMLETTLNPSEPEIQTVQKVFLEFVSQMHHWVMQTRKRNSLYLRDEISNQEFRTQSEQQLVEIFGEFVLFDLRPRRIDASGAFSYGRNEYSPRTGVLQSVENQGEMFILTTQQAEITYRYCMVRIDDRYKLLDSRHFSTRSQPFEETHL